MPMVQTPLPRSQYPAIINSSAACLPARTVHLGVFQEPSVRVKVAACLHVLDCPLGTPPSPAVVLVPIIDQQPNPIPAPAPG